MSLTEASKAPITPQAPKAPITDVSISLRKLVLIRWVAVIGQAATVLIVHFQIGFDV